MFSNPRADEMELIILKMWPYVSYVFAAALVIILIQYTLVVFVHNKIRLITPMVGLSIYSYPIVVSTVMNINLPSDHGIVNDLIRPYFVIIVIVTFYALYRGYEIEVGSGTNSTIQSTRQELSGLEELKNRASRHRYHEQSTSDTENTVVTTDLKQQHKLEPEATVRKISLD
ncbi:hypothetical protein [Vibrio coralliilyticus]|uniref:hypothetical protein n=1 Tax=Vibrio coralliilyticus TaxID=190893 RepID=UPI000BAC245B|nr:hypothetical protein [Vibrio coralliilyticus]PAW02276.1 hypothetical protein CKJ79_16580 [Vibrio coralliilyticus]